MDEHLLRPVRGDTVKRRIPRLGHAMAALDTRRPQQIAHNLGLDLVGDGDQLHGAVHAAIIRSSVVCQGITQVAEVVWFVDGYDLDKMLETGRVWM